MAQAVYSPLAAKHLLIVCLHLQMQQAWLEGSSASWRMTILMYLTTLDDNLDASASQLTV